MSNALITALSRLAAIAENSKVFTDDKRWMPAAGVADTLYEAADCIEKLEAALRHVSDCLYIDDYGDYGLLSNFDAEKVNKALEGEQ